MYKLKVETIVTLPTWQWGQFMEEPQGYFSYLLRVWLAGDGDQPHWRASLEDTHTSERRGFATLEAMCEFLHQRIVLSGDLKNINQEGSES
jgi:hypothetical protein